MAAVVDIRDTAPAVAGASGLVVRATPHRGSTYLDLAADDGIHTVRVGCLPDPAAARDACVGMRRVISVRIDVQGDEVQCVLRGLGHRYPLERTIALAAALGLVRSGIPTLAVDHRDA
jgi:hypothetical protein